MTGLIYVRIQAGNRKTTYEKTWILKVQMVKERFKEGIVTRNSQVIKQSVRKTEEKRWDLLQRYGNHTYVISNKYKRVE